MSFASVPHAVIDSTTIIAIAHAIRKGRSCVFVCVIVLFFVSVLVLQLIKPISDYVEFITYQAFRVIIPPGLTEPDTGLCYCPCCDVGV